MNIPNGIYCAGDNEIDLNEFSASWGQILQIDYVLPVSGFSF